MAILQRLPVDEAHLEAFCRQWKITKLELFGSMLIEPSRAQDIGLLVTFGSDARWGLFEHERMQNELARLLGRSVDLVSRRAIEARPERSTPECHLRQRCARLCRRMRGAT